MKKRLIVPTFIASLALITGGLSFAAVKNNSSVEETFDATDPNANWGGLRATPFGDRYTTNWSSEPKYTTQNPLQFTTMNVGDTWKNYQGFESGDKPITVAVIDSGIDIYHEDFLSADAKNVTITESNVESYSILDPKSCYIYDTSKGYYSSSVKTEVGIKKAYDTDTYDEDNDEYYSHGTASAACIGAAINGVGGLGIAPKCNLLIIRMDFYFTSLDKAIRYAADNGADVINMSLGAYAESFEDGYKVQQSGSASTATALTSAINYALGKDCVVVAAAGNEKTNHKSYPACNAGVIGVGALASKSTSSAADFSNFNLDTDTSSTNNNVDVMAPGYVYTANMDVSNGPKSSGNLKDTSYQNTQGTSFASPLTAGAVALARSKYPEKTHTEIENLLISTCTDIGTTGWDKKFGYGRVNITTLLGTTFDVEELTLSESSIQLYNNGVTKSIVGDVIPSNATNRLIHWTSSNTNVVTVPATSNAGTEVTITPQGVGTTTITATSDFDSSISSTCTVTVSPYVNSEFTLSVGKSTLMEGETTQAIVNFKNTNPTYSDVLYESSNEKVATISDSGLITAVSAGATTITAMSSDDMQEITITVTGDPTKQTGTITHSDWPAGGTSGTGSALSVSKGVISISLDKGYKAASEIRSYGGGTFTLSITNGTVVSFKVLCPDSENKGGTISVRQGGGSTSYGYVNDGNYVTYTAGTSPSSSITIGNSSQWRFSTITVTYKLNETPVVSNYTVSFNANTGSGTMSDDTTNGSSYVVPECQFTKTNYSFNKWALGSVTGTQYSVGDTISNISSDIVLYALWTEEQSTGGDTEDTGSKKYTFTDKTWAPWTSVKDGAGFSNGGVQITAGATGANANSKDTFSNVKKAIVTYCTNASKGTGTVLVKIGSTTLGSFNVTTTGGTTPRTAEITSQTALSGIANISVECSVNSIYICGIEIFEGTGGGDTPVTPTPKEYTVTFNANGGSLGTNPITKTVEEGTSITLPTLTRDNYTFLGWSTSQSSSTASYEGGASYTVNSNVTLYAIWSQNQSTGGDDDDISYWTSWISSNQTALSTGGTTLVNALRNKIANVEPGTINTPNYDGLWTAYAKTDGIPGSNGTKLYDMYGGCEFTFGTDQDKGSHSKVGDTYNREHSVPKSWFNQAHPAYSDIIHVVPTDSVVNGTRSNWAFGEVDSVSKTYPFDARSYNGVQYQKAGVSKYGTPKAINGVSIKSDQTYVFEPDDQYKGDFARIYMYFAVRYGGTTCSATTDSGSAIFSSNCTNSNPYVTNYGLALLKKWHELDPVSEKERTRNNAVQEVQGNRNPFVDYPQWADKIFGTTTTGGDSQKTLSYISISGDYKTSFTVGDTFSFGGTVTAHYNDNSTADVTSQATFSGYNMNVSETQTVTVSYTEGGIPKTTTYTITISGSGSGGEDSDSTTYELCTSTADLVVGAKYVIGNGKSGTTKFMSNVSNNNNRKTTENSVSNNQTTISSETLVLKLGSATSGYTLETINYGGTNGYLASAASGNNNYCLVQSTAGIVTISISSSSTTINIGPHSTRNLLSYNGSSATNPIFACYSSQQTSGVYLYKQVTGASPTPTPKVNSVTLNESSLSFDLNGTKSGSLTATVDADVGADYTLEWSSSNTSVATISGNSNIVTINAVGVGTSTITASAGGEEATCIINVTDSSPIAVNGVSLNKPTLTLTVGSSETLIPTISPTNATNKNVTWSSSNTSAASVDNNGKVSAIDVGSTTITVTTQDGGYTAHCTVTVTAAPVITYQLEADNTSVPYMSGTNHSVSVGVKLYQYTNGVKGSQVSSGSANVDTSILGPQDVTYVYQSVTYHTEVKVTNVGAIQNGEGSSTTKSSSFIKQEFTANGTKTVDGLTLTLNNNGEYYGYDGTKGQQIGSGSKPAKSMTLTTSVSGTITKVIVNTSGASSVNASVSVTVGGTAFKCGSNTSKAISATATNYEFIGSGTGDIVITWTQTSSKALYFKTISVTAITPGEKIFTDKQQAEAYADYFVRLTRTEDTCLASSDSDKLTGLKAIWSELKTEYEAMVGGSKDSFCEDSENAEILKHYQYIISKFGKSSKYGNDGLEDFVKDSGGNKPAASNSGLGILNISNYLEPATIVTATVAVAGAVAIGLYFSVKKRKEI